MRARRGFVHQRREQIAILSLRGKGSTFVDKKEGKKKLYISLVNYQGTHAEYDQAVVEAKEQKLERDFTGAPLPKGYWISWIILSMVVVMGFIAPGFHLI